MQVIFVSTQIRHNKSLGVVFQIRIQLGLLLGDTTRLDRAR